MAHNDPDVIFLQPACCADSDWGRVWCDHDPADCADGKPWVKYTKEKTYRTHTKIKNIPSDADLKQLASFLLSANLSNEYTWIEYAHDIYNLVIKLGKAE